MLLCTILNNVKKYKYILIKILWLLLIFLFNIDIKFKLIIQLFLEQLLTNLKRGF